MLIYTLLLRSMPLHAAFPLTRGVGILGVQLAASVLVFHEMLRPTEIAGAVLVPLNNLLVAPRQHLSGDSILFYCAQGIRSAVACEVAAAVGVARIYNLEGGIQEWGAQGYPIET